MQLTISIVSFNTKDLLRRCLKSIFRYTKNLKFEVIVVDNASTDGSAEMTAKEFPKVKLIKNKVNKWYTGANNQALKLARGKYFMILNSDTFIESNVFKQLADYLDKHPGVGAVEPRQRNEAGRIEPTSSRHNRWWWDLCELTLLHRLIRPKSLAYFRLKGRSRRQVYPAEVISDGAMMVRTAALKKIRGYDERFKLYYTENDLCRRLQSAPFASGGMKAVHLGTAEIRHRVSASTDQAGWKTISAVYAADARQYYLKYHSRLQALSLFLAMKLSNFLVWTKPHWGWLSLTVLATVLRFWRLPELMTFIGDQGRDYLAARDMALTGVWPLTGIPSSVPWLKQGPLFIWVTALCLKLGRFDPAAPAVFTAVLGVVTVYWLYRLSRSWPVALVMATAPLAVIHSRMPYHLSPIPAAALGYLWALKKNSAAWAVFFSSLLLQFELSNLPLVFLTLFWFWRRWRELLKSVPLGLVPFIPKIIYDLSHGFSQTFGLAAWTGYRLLHLGEYGNASAAIFEYWTKFIAPGYPLIAAAAAAISLVYLFKVPRFIRLTLGFALAGFYVHGAPSEGYFLVLFPVWAWLLGRNKVLALLLAVFSLVNLFSHDFYTYGPNLAQRQALVRQLPDSFRLAEYSQNPGWASYLDNYRYLIWQAGKDYLNPSGPVYSVYDGDSAAFNQPLKATVFHFDRQKLIKYD